MHTCNAPRLDARLAAAFAYVRPGHVAADIGCDHGKLSAALAGSGRCPLVLACDLRPGPLEKARVTCAPCGNKVQCRLGSGLEVLAPGEADDIIIAGMGAETIIEILEAAPWVREEKIPLVLQPMSSLPELRDWLEKNGYAIAREQLAREGDTLYVVMGVTAGEMGEQTPGQLWAGRQSRDPLRGEYLAQQERKLRRAVEGMAKSRGEETQQRRRELEQVLSEISAMKEEWQKWQM